MAAAKGQKQTAQKSGTKSQPKEEVFGTDIPRTSGARSRGCPGPKLRSGGQNPGKRSIAARTSMTRRRGRPRHQGISQSEKLWAEFSFPKKVRKRAKKLSTSDFQSEVGEVFGEIDGELPAKFGRRFSSFFCWGKSSEHFPPKLHRKFHHQTSLRGSGWRRAQKSAKTVPKKQAKTRRRV